jgi:hypothetical protein
MSKMKRRVFKRRECNSRCASCRAAAGFRHSSFVLRHSHCFRLRKRKQRGYLKIRVQLDHARQRERGKQRAGRN